MSYDRSLAAVTASAASSKYRWYVLAVLTAVYGCHSIDRWVLSALLEPIKREFGASDTAMGLLAGIVYTTAFSATALPVGYLIDRVNRRNLLAAILFLWSGLTATSGFAQSFSALVLARMAIGAVESGASPAAMSLIADYFPPQQRSSAIGIFYLSTAFGIATSFAVGAYVAAEYGWRAAFFIAGVPGLILSLVVIMTLREPARGATDERTAPDSRVAPSLVEALKSILSSRSLMYLFLAILLASFVASTINTWSVSVLIRVHGFGLREAGLAAAIGAGLFQAVGGALAGTLADRFGGHSLVRLLVSPAITCLLTIPFGIGIALADTVPLAVVCLFGMGLCLAAWIGPAFAFVSNVTAPRMRGVVFSAVQIGTNLVGSGLGPLITGVLSDRLGGPRALATALSFTILVNLLASTFFLLAAQAYRGQRAGSTAVHALESRP